MTNINHDKLILNEPYLIEYKGGDFSFGFYRNIINERLPSIAKLDFDETNTTPSKEIPLRLIKSLTHLERGEVIK